ncbi:ankyrin repeat domain-containing protein [Campylobacter corcagiensis]|uniref:Ankyrin repeat domain-containing protein n=1 Tax=Campylobacter corcagiensis TaxID=1448857 RepID=A0A7M1LK02_9BACT|nr:ankyrin repeat domain-containing protein [Campylobacter corcagiensis]
MFTNSINTFKFINLIILSLLLSSCDNNKSHFTVTADTVIKPGSEISKYVTQDEINSFGFRYWDIDNNYTEFVNPIAIPLRDALKQKNTNKVLSYLKDNNLSADIQIEDGTTPIMYSSFYNDINTTNELIKLGADVHKKDKYGLNALAYAISMNSIDVVKALINSGVKFEEVPLTQGYILTPSYRNIEKLVIDGDNIEIIYKYNNIQKDYDTPKGYGYMFDDIVFKNWLELAKIILDSGYKPYPYFFNGDEVLVGNSIYDIFPKEEVNNAMDIELEEYKNQAGDNFDLKLFIDDFSYDYSLYKVLENIPNHEPMLNLLLEHNISGQPSKELMKKVYDECYDGYIYRYNLKQKYMKENINKKVKHLDFYLKYCSDKNGTFKNTKEFINYKNGNNRNYEIDSFLYSNKDDPTKVIYIEK